VAATAITLLLLAHVVLSIAMFVQYRYWLPVVFPVMGSLLTMHVCLVTWRVIFEQAEQRRVKSIFSRVVSPNVMDELLGAEKLSLGGARREVTVLFADVRGFTEFTDKSQEKAAEYVAEHNLPDAEVEAFFDEQARETLSTVNTYLAIVADKVKVHDGTLDKFIGDCVMAFWGAPTAHSGHAGTCVQAAIEAQRAVYLLNRERADENQRRELENLARLSAGLAPKPLLPILLIGTGINTGMATVGLMGSEQHQINYTVFGREVNLASRLETLSGSGRILIGETTHNCLLRDDPALAATCLALPDLQKLKGFGTAVKVYEVPWRPPDWAPFDEEFIQRATTDPSTTAFIRRENL
jgi:adenylate cyclase